MTAAERVDLLTLTLRDRDVWTSAYMSGYMVGHETRWRAADEHADDLFRKAAHIVHRLAGLPPRDRAADQASAERREAWWTARRGQVAS